MVFTLSGTDNQDTILRESHLSTFLLPEDLKLPTQNLSQIIANLSSFILMDLLQTISWISVELQQGFSDMNDSRSNESQLKLLSYMMPNSEAQRIIKICKIEKKDPVFFHFGQIFLTLKLALHYSTKNGKPVKTKNDRMIVFHSLLSISARFFNKSIADKQDLTVQMWKMEALYDFVNIKTRLGLLRNYRILKDIFADFSMLERLKYLSGLNAHDIFISFLAVFVFLNRKKLNTEDRIIMEIERDFKNLKSISIENIKLACDLISIPLKEMQRNIVRFQDSLLTPYDYLLFLENPLIKTSEDSYLCCSLTFIQYYMNMGVLNVFRNLLRKANLKNKKALLNEFHKRKSDAFHNYVLRSLKTLGLADRLQHESVNNVELGDAYILYPDDVILIEIKSKDFEKISFRFRRIDDVKKTIRKMFLNNGRIQLVERIKDLESKKIQSKWIEPKIVKRYWPLYICASETLPRSFLVRELVFEEPESNNLTKIMPIVVISISEFDSLVAYANRKGKQVLELIQDYVKHFRIKSLSFYNYLVDRFPEGIDGIPEHLSSSLSEFEAIFETKQGI